MYVEKPHKGETDTWLTPPWVYKSLGEFDLDPCAHPLNPTAKRLVVYPREDGLKIDWDELTWVDPQSCSCVAQKALVADLGEDGKDVHQVHHNATGNNGVLSNQDSGGKNISQLVVPPMCSDLCQRETGQTPFNSDRKSQAYGREKSVRHESEGEVKEERLLFHQQPSKETPVQASALVMERGPLASMQAGVESELCLLRKDKQEADPGSFHSIDSSRLPGDSSLEHASGVHEMQHDQEKSSSQKLEGIKIAICGNCGKTGPVYSKKTRVFLNPPYGPATGVWLNRLAVHGRGTALVNARTDTKWLQNHLRIAQCVLFIAGRVKFLTGELKEKGSPATPSVLLAYGREDAEILFMSNIKGFRIKQF